MILLKNRELDDLVAVNPNKITIVMPTENGSLITFSQFDSLLVQESVMEILRLISKET